MHEALTVAATIATGVILFSVGTAVLMFLVSHVTRVTDFAPEGFRFIFVVPALNEANVIVATVRHLIEIGAHAVVVVDDGSDDDTSKLVRSIKDPTVRLLKRTMPDARRGKGAALNAAYTLIRRSPKLARGAGPDAVIICVVDADGRLDRYALGQARMRFADPKVGACQVAVRIRNRRQSVWTHLQHFEFVAFAQLFQRAREWTFSVGLGGNGQFVRLSALHDLGPEPWSACLTEDMDLGIRLLLRGWRNRFIGESFVSQQAVPDLRRLVRQRVRWFQGTLQCLRHLPRVMGSPQLPLRARMDLSWTLLTPLVLLLLSPVMLAGAAFVVLSLPGVLTGVVSGSRLLPVYALAAVVPFLLTFAFWRYEPDTTPVRALLIGHMFAFYGFLWPIVGWRAAVKELRGIRSWDRTPRVNEPDSPDAAVRRAA